MQNRKNGKTINRKDGLKAVNKSKEQILDSDIESAFILFLRLEKVYVCLANLLRIEITLKHSQKSRIETLWIMGC